MKAHLSKKYKGKIAEKILSSLDFSMPLDFNGFIDMLERLLNISQDKLRRIAFNVFDFSEDKFIC
jgi:Ca2+-binding EF-hand superfamily protein